MIKNRKKLEEFEKELARNENLPYKEALAIYESLFKEAMALGAVSAKNVMDGFDTKIRIAKALNTLK